MVKRKILAFSTVALTVAMLFVLTAALKSPVDTIAPSEDSSLTQDDLFDKYFQELFSGSFREPRAVQNSFGSDEKGYRHIAIVYAEDGIEFAKIGPYDDDQKAEFNQAVNEALRAATAASQS